MTDKQIEQKAFDEAVKYSSLEYEQVPFADGYIAGAHSRDEEVKRLYNSLEHFRSIINSLRNPRISVEDKQPEERQEDK